MRRDSMVCLTQVWAESRVLAVAADRAHFRVAHLEDSGLADGCAAAVVCVDALSFAADRTAA
ncbi:conserved hypothetical protein [Streptomyces sviceus ATCC 29083]|uniref:Uncharacterized protein n=2 Tax=Streptomyces TaxID=1883 RepID=B5HRV9_STRX2|nr:conserved hypothetical protein [Streptomyces sviceus ATCC 29083]